MEALDVQWVTPKVTSGKISPVRRPPISPAGTPVERDPMGLPRGDVDAGKS